MLTVPQVIQDSNLPFSSEEKVKGKILSYELGSVLPWLSAFNSLLRTLKQKLCSPLVELRIWHWQNFHLQRCNGNGDRQNLKSPLKEAFMCQQFKNPDV